MKKAEYKFSRASNGYSRKERKEDDKAARKLFKKRLRDEVERCNGMSEDDGFAVLSGKR